jgi:argininosuccinate lyase
VATAIEKGKKLSELTIEEYKKYSSVFEADLLDAIDIETCVNNRSSQGGPSPASILEQLKRADLDMKAVIEKLG